MNSKQINQCSNLKKLFECINDSIKQINADSINIKNDFESKLLNLTSKSQFMMNFNIKKNENFTLNSFQIIYQTL